MSTEPLSLTPAQREQLLKLHVAKAHASASGRNPFQLQGLKPVVLGKLRDARLVASESRQQIGYRATAYWLTPAGIVEARAWSERLGEAQHG